METATDPPISPSLAHDQAPGSLRRTERTENIGSSVGTGILGGSSSLTVQGPESEAMSQQRKGCFTHRGSRTVGPSRTCCLILDRSHSGPPGSSGLPAAQAS